MPYEENWKTRLKDYLYSGNGFIEGTELDQFLEEFIQSVAPKNQTFQVKIFHLLLKLNLGCGSKVKVGEKSKGQGLVQDQGRGFRGRP